MRNSSSSYMLHISVVCLLIVLVSLAASLSLRDVSGKLNLGAVEGYVAAVADVNNDRFTDLLVVQGSECKVLIWKDGHFSESATIMRPGTIHSVLPADFDGDGRVDLLLATERQSSEDADREYNIDALSLSAQYTITVHWGDRFEGPPVTVSTGAGRHPSLVDVNLDLLPDIVIPGDGTDRAQIFCASFGHTFDNCSTSLPGDAAHTLQRTPSFLVDGNTGSPVISSLTLANTAVRLNSWTVDSAGMWQPIAQSVAQLPIGPVALLGMEAWQDLDLDGTLDLIVPVCWDINCVNSSIVILFMKSGQSFTGKDAVVHTIDLWTAAGNVSFSTTSDVPFTDGPLLPSIQCGDLNLDGYVDAIIVGVDMEGYRRAIFLHNSHCSRCAAGVSRTFRVEVLADAGSDVLLASVFDLYGDGLPDVIVSREASSNVSIAALQLRTLDRSAFVKVIVASCASHNACSSEPGTTMLGTLVSYKSAQHNLNDVTSSIVPLLSQVGTLTLQLPNVILGLGQPITYVRSMTVTLPSLPGTILSHTWPAIIPNSKVLIKANPPHRPSEWEAQLLLNAGQAVWQTAVVFTCTCIALALAFIFLYRREMKEDELEKRERSHQFHFDAL